MDIVAIIAMLSIVLNVGLILKEVKKNNSPNEWISEISKFYINMEKLGFDRDYANDCLKEYSNFEELKDVNKRMSKAIIKQML